jgi:hypothetical protein
VVPVSIEHRSGSLSGGIGDVPSQRWGSVFFAVHDARVDTGVKGLQGVVGVSLFVEHLDEALAAAEALGVPRKAGARFEQYLNILKEMAAFDYPRAFPWENDPQRRSLVFEATTQSQQFLDALLVCGNINQTTARKKLTLVVSGSSLPPRDKDTADVSRNTLFEFAVARALQNKGFVVDMTDDAEDIRAEYAGLQPFVVECKRPTHPGSFSKAVQKSRRQLWKRCGGGLRLGLPVFGIDRSGGLGQKTPNVPTGAELEATIDQILRRHVMRIRDAERQIGKRFFPVAPVAGVLLTTAVFLWDTGGLFSVSQMGLFCTGPEEHPLSLAIKSVLSTTIELV